MLGNDDRKGIRPSGNPNIIQSRRALESTRDALSSIIGFTRLTKYRDDDFLQDAFDITTEHLSNFLAVRSCGYLEVILNETVRSHASLPKYASIRKHLNDSTNRGAKANKERILYTAALYNQEAYREIEEILTKNDHENSMNLKLLIKSRNKISHGESDATTPEERMRQANSALEIGTVLEDRLDPANWTASWA